MFYLPPLPGEESQMSVLLLPPRGTMLQIELKVPTGDWTTKRMTKIQAEWLRDWLTEAVERMED